MSDTILDSLPYYDVDIEQPSLRALVDAEIARELKRTPKPTTEPHVPSDSKQLAVSIYLVATLSLQDPKVVASQKNGTFVAELEKKLTEEHTLDITRYSLPAPTDPNASEEEWTRALNNARSQLEHQSIR